MSKKLINAIADMKEAEALALVKEMVKSGSEPSLILESVRLAMDIVGKRYENKTYFLPELIMAGEMMNQITELIKPSLAGLPAQKRLGKVLLGTVKGDIHSIGKNIVTFMLDVNGYEVLDLGVDVAPEKFIEAVRDFQPQVLGLSGFLTLAYDEMKNTVSAIKNAGLRDNIKIMIGGGQMDEQVKVHTGADAYGKDAVSAVTLTKNWIGG
ncbi:MAG: cobalamin-dependent protein [Spirochaetales bacterium]|nr:cobalamin-dependent protein [Spirochaetales bacterium]